MAGFYLTKRQQYERLKAQLDKDYRSFEPQFKDLNDYFLPSRGRFVLSSDSNRGDRRNQKILDNTGYLAARTLGSGMQAGVTNPSRPWKRLTTPDPELAEYGPVREWLDLVDQRMSTLFLRSNLYNILPNSYEDLGVFGTAVKLMEPDMRTVANFESIPLGSYRIAKNRRGQVNLFYREVRFTIRQLIDHFGRYDKLTGKPNWDCFSQHVKNQYDNSNYEEWVEVGHVIQPNAMYNPRLLDSKYKLFESCYFELSSREYKDGSEKFLRESGYDYFPVLAPRWRTTGMDVYGTDCPGMASLGDNKQLQHGRRMETRAIAKSVDPAMRATSGMKGRTMSLVSGDVTFLDDPNAKFEAAHEVRLDLSHLKELNQDTRQLIKRAFFEDLFLMLSESDRKEITATEVIERKEEKLLALGPVLEQLNQDVLNPLIDNMFILMNQAGMVPPAPKELQGMPLKVEYISIMAQAQKIVGIGAMDRLLQMASIAKDFDPSAIQKIDMHEFVDQYADALGISPKIVRADDRVAEMQSAQVQAGQAAAAPEQISQLASAAKDLSQTDLNNDSVLARLLAQAKAGQLVPQ